MAHPDNFASRGADNLAEVRRVTISELERIAAMHDSGNKDSQVAKALHDLIVMLKTR